MIKELAHSNDLLFAWTSRTIRGRYQQSLLGWLWAIINPAMSAVVFSILFTKIIPVDTGTIPYPLFAYAAIVPWTFFTTSLADMTASLVQNMALVQKIYFPRETLPAAAMLARLLDFGVASAIVVVLIIIYQVPVSLGAVVFLPIIILAQILLLTGLGLFLSALNVFYRDIQSLLTLVIQIWFYASPIVYPVSMVPPGWQKLYFLNPMAGILESYRDVLLRSAQPGNYLWIALGISFLVMIFGYSFFRRKEWLFADIV